METIYRRGRSTLVIRLLRCHSNATRTSVGRLHWHRSARRYSLTDLYYMPAYTLDSPSSRLNRFPSVAFVNEITHSSSSCLSLAPFSSHVASRASTTLRISWGSQSLTRRIISCSRSRAQKHNIRCPIACLTNNHGERTHREMPMGQLDEVHNTEK